MIIFFNTFSVKKKNILVGLIQRCNFSTLFIIFVDSYTNFPILGNNSDAT